MNDIPPKRMESISRICAAAVVALIDAALKQKRPADRALGTFLRANHQLGSRDRRIISETLFSCLRWWGWLKHLAPTRFLEKPVSEPDREENGGFAAVRPALASEYEPFFGLLSAAWLLEGRSQLPPSVYWWMFRYGVQESDLPQIHSDSSLQERRHVLRPFFGKDAALPPMPLEDLIPGWAISQMELPCAFSQFAEWMQARPPVWLRAQSRDLDRIESELKETGVPVTRSENLPLALRAGVTGVNLRMLPAFRNGFLEIQDISSQCIGHICHPQQSENWWDCCAGAGGKTLHLSWLMKGTGNILATDKRLYKLDDLKKRSARTGRSNIRCREWLGISVPRYREHFHGVLLDAPCSCSGTWRRNPDARWTTTQEEVKEIAALQKTLLENVSSAVAPGGTLVYATCSLFDCENRQVVQDFLTRHPEFELAPFSHPLTGAATDGMLQIWPWEGNGDAMFAAKMRRTGPVAQSPEKEPQP